MKFLLIDSIGEFADGVKTYFTSKGMEVDVQDNFDSILDDFIHVNLYKYDAFIFSISGENISGLNLIEYMYLIDIKKPVIFISYTDSIELLANVFSRGAEDYLTLPFNIKELELRIMKSIRKKISEDEIVLPNDYSYIYSESSIAHKHLVVDLTKKQKELLYLLMTNRNNLVTYEMIKESVYDGNDFSNNAIATHIRDIRKKVEGIPIKAVKGEGYILKI